MQSPKEVVRRAIEFTGPERLPVWFVALGVSDIHYFKWNQIGVGDKSQRTSVDEWGCVWARSETANMGQVKGHPLEDWKALEAFAWPDADNPAFYDGIETRLAGSEGKYVATGIFMLLFERLQALHGFENTLVDLVENRPRMEALADRIVEFDLGVIRNLAARFPGQIDGFMFTDDWGTQQGPLISPRLWNAFFRPRYERIFQAIHAAGWHVWMHSCGRINLLLDSIIACGVDVIELQQPRALGIEAIGCQFRGKVCFASLCDIQETLPRKSAQGIEAEAGLLLEHWGTPEGGFILIDYGDGGAIGVDLDRKRTMLEAFQRLDPWRKK